MARARGRGGRFDPARAEFSTYAVPRIRGAMIDGLRARHGRDGSSVRSRIERAVSLERRVRIKGEHDGSTLEALLADECAADDALLEEDRAAVIQRELLRLPEIERVVLSMHYFDGLLLREIGQVFGISESRACEIRRKALEQLRRRLLHLT